MFSGLQRRSPGFTSAMLSPVTRQHKEKETLISVLMFASGPFHGKISTLALALNIEAPKTFFGLTTMVTSLFQSYVMLR